MIENGARNQNESEIEGVLLPDDEQPCDSLNESDVSDSISEDLHDQDKTDEDKDIDEDDLANDSDQEKEFNF